MNERATTRQVTTTLIAGGIGVGLLFVLTRYHRNIRETLSKFVSKASNAERILRNKSVTIVSSHEECRSVVEKINM